MIKWTRKKKILATLVFVFLASLATVKIALNIPVPMLDPKRFLGYLLFLERGGIPNYRGIESEPAFKEAMEELADPANYDGRIDIRKYCAHPGEDFRECTTSIPTDPFRHQADCPYRRLGTYLWLRGDLGFDALD